MPRDRKHRAFQGWLSDLPATLAEELLSLGESVQFDARQVIYHIGDQTRSLWCILDGIVRMNIATQEQSHRFGHLIGPGFWFGEYELLTGQPRLIEMQTATECHLLRFNHQAIAGLSEREPELWRWIAILSAQHTLLALSAADDLMLRKPAQRAAALLLRLTENRAAHPESLPRNLVPASQTDLADALSMSLSTSGTILRAMEDAGAIALDYRAVRVLDVKKLRAYLTDD